jgi:hypothetical protein
VGRTTRSRRVRVGIPHMARKDQRGMESVNPVQRPAPTMERPRESARRLLGRVWSVRQVSWARGGRRRGETGMESDGSWTAVEVDGLRVWYVPW